MANHEVDQGLIFGEPASDETLDDLPDDLIFNKGHLLSLVTHSILMVISGVGNITVLTILVNRRYGTGQRSSTRIDLMLLHLALADLIVTFMLMPIDLAWAATVNWRAGDTACRIASFFRVFGLYESSFVIVCIGIDRYYAVMKPLRLSEADRRGKLILSLSWVASALSSLPQIFVFRVQRHPNHEWFEQCKSIVTHKSHQISYTLFNMMVMYIMPLVVIIYCYGSIVKEIWRRVNEPNSDKFRRSTLGFLGKAKTRTLKMTITIVIAFFVCWTPYYFITCWYILSWESAENLNPIIQRALFIFACTNSSVNPLVYGAFNIRRKNRLKKMQGSHNTCTTEVRLQAISTPTRLTLSAQSDNSDSV